MTEERKNAVLYIRWQGGASEEITVPLPPKSAEKWRCSPEIIERVRLLAQSMPDQDIVQLFNNEGIKTNKGNHYTLCSIKWIRHKYGIAAYNLRKPGELSISEIAQKLNVSHYVVRYWIERGIINARKANDHIFWILLTPEKEEALQKKLTALQKYIKHEKLNSKNKLKEMHYV